MQQQTILIIGAFLGMLSVILGAFGAHYLKKNLSSEQLKSFETGVKYQMYHSLILLIIGYNTVKPPNTMALCFVLGILFFSFSIYGLVLSESKGKKFRFLGPVTPIGGLLLILGWLQLLIFLL